MPKGYQPDGIDQLDALLGKNDNPNRNKPLFWKIMLHGQPVMINPTTGYPGLLFIKNGNLVATKTGYHELYDAINDPLEKNDLA